MPAILGGEQGVFPEKWEATAVVWTVSSESPVWKESSLRMDLPLQTGKWQASSPESDRVTRGPVSVG